MTEEGGGRTYYKGKLFGINTVMAASRIGKVAAAATATHLIVCYKVDFVIFTGVAGAIDPSLNVGDVVVASGSYTARYGCQAVKFRSIHEIPLLKITIVRSQIHYSGCCQRGHQRKFIRGMVFHDIDSFKPY